MNRSQRREQAATKPRPVRKETAAKARKGCLFSMLKITIVAVLIVVIYYFIKYAIS